MSYRGYVACLWDDVAFRRTSPAQKYCSERCRVAAAEDAERNRKHSGWRDSEGCGYELAEIAVHTPGDGRTPRHLVGPRERAPTPRLRRSVWPAIDLMSERQLELERRTDDETQYRPRRRLRWIDTNLAVLE